MRERCPDCLMLMKIIKSPVAIGKIITIQGDDSTEIASFVFDQDTPKNADFCDERHIISIREIEERTGLDFSTPYLRKHRKSLRSDRPRCLRNSDVIHQERTNSISYDLRTPDTVASLDQE